MAAAAVARESVVAAAVVAAAVAAVVAAAVARESELVSAGVFRHYSHKPKQGHWQPGAAPFLSACGNARVERAAFSSTPSLSYSSIRVNPPVLILFAIAIGIAIDRFSIHA